jgi:hypothetical protein
VRAARHLDSRRLEPLGQRAANICLNYRNMNNL